ncbi:reverse transcriptase-like protein [Candidatus Gracilibacteria bacterium]|nr:reverse transcriptase-like protein [Candidatus Gracilibacteria bacterium]
MLLRVFTDGGSRGNPGEAGIGVYITDKEGKALERRYKYLGITTNNVAEYTGALYGIKRARELGATQIELSMDSKLVIEQLSGNWKIKNEYLKQLAQDIKYHSKGLEITYNWIPREQNSIADELSNKAMDKKI